MLLIDMSYWWKAKLAFEDAETKSILWGAIKKTGNFHAAGPVNEPIPFPGGREERKGKFDIIWTWSSQKKWR